MRVLERTRGPEHGKGDAEIALAVGEPRREVSIPLTCQQNRERKHPVPEIGSRLLARYVGIADEVQEVVDDLESEPEILAE